MPGILRSELKAKKGEGYYLEGDYLAGKRLGRLYEKK